VDRELRSSMLNAADAAFERCCQRLKEDLGLDEEAVEVILNLRNQVTALQARLHQLESTLEIYETGYGSRVTSYRQVFYEADWEDI
jgi:hypothetical protein